MSAAMAINKGRSAFLVLPVCLVINVTTCRMAGQFVFPSCLFSNTVIICSLVVTTTVWAQHFIFPRLSTFTAMLVGSVVTAANAAFSVIVIAAATF